jgi:hypothetical protein
LRLSPVLARAWPWCSGPNDGLPERLSWRDLACLGVRFDWASSVGGLFIFPHLERNAS